MLWVDKYRPRSLDKIIVHREVADNLKNLVSEQDCPHLLFYGPPGAGKKTLIIALLKQIFGPGAEKVKVENRPWKIEAGTRTIEVELTTVSSNHHVELNPSDVGFQDKYVVQEIIKEMAKSRPIDINGNKGYKVLVLNEVDKLSKEAQHSLRRTMELYSGVCRIILCCNSASKVIEAVRSRCLNVRVNAPSKEQIIEVLEYIAKKEGLQLPIGFAGRIAMQSERNLRRAILCFETCRVQQYPFTDNQPVQPMDWEQYISEIASDIVNEQSPKRLFMVRGKIYELLVNCIPPEVVLKRLVFELMKKLDSELKHEVCHWAAYYEHRMHLGQKAIFHIEEGGDAQRSKTKSKSKFKFESLGWNSRSCNAKKSMETSSINKLQVIHQYGEARCCSRSRVKMKMQTREPDQDGIQRASCIRKMNKYTNGEDYHNLEFPLEIQDHLEWSNYMKHVITSTGSSQES